MFIRIALFKTNEFHLLRNNLVANLLHDLIVGDIIRLASHFLLCKLYIGCIQLCLRRFLLNLGCADCFVKSCHLFNRSLNLIIGTVYLMLFAESRQFFFRLFRFPFAFCNALVKELHEQRLRLLVHIRLHEEKVINDHS